MSKKGLHALFKQTQRELKHLSWLEKNLSGSKQLKNGKRAVLEKRTALCELEGDSYDAVVERLSKRSQR